MPNQSVTVTDDTYRRNCMPVSVNHVFKGRALARAVTRAKRWMRSGVPLSEAPTHIKLKVLAFRKASRYDFREAMREAYGKDVFDGEL